MRQRLFVSWICPRGIVAAAVAGLFSILLAQAGIAGSNQLEALVFVTVAVTVTVQGLTARPIARLLRVDVPPLRGAIVVGADRFARLLARLLVMLGRQVVMIDRNPRFCRAARSENFSVYEGDALSVDTLEEAGTRYADTVVAVTHNPELNTLVAQRVRDSFRVQRVLALADDPETGARAAPSGVFPGNFPGSDETNRLLRLGLLSVVEYEAAAEGSAHSLAELPYAPGEFALLVRCRQAVLIATSDQSLGAGDHLWCAQPASIPSPLTELLTPVSEIDPGTAVAAPQVPGRHGSPPT
jgi:Trk K+ transport system NAD-binding subunit